MEGTVTISIDLFDSLRKQAEECEYMKNQMEVWQQQVRNMISVDQKEWDAAMKEIDDDRKLTERQIDKKVDEARKFIKIIVDAEQMKRYIKRMLPPIKELSIDDALREVKRTKDDELEAVQICFEYEEDGQ